MSDRNAIKPLPKPIKAIEFCEANYDAILKLMGLKAERRYRTPLLKIPRNERWYFVVFSDGTWVNYSEQSLSDLFVYRWPVNHDEWFYLSRRSR